MRKPGLGLACIALVILIPGVSVAVELSPDCGYVFNPSTGDPPGFDAMGSELFLLLQAAGIPDYPATYWEADLEADGIPDHYQMAMLGAVLCSGHAMILSQFNANVEVVEQEIANFGAVFDALAPRIGDLNSLAGDLITWADTLGPEHEEWRILGTDVGNSLYGLAGEFYHYLNIWNMLSPVVHFYANAFAAHFGLSTEMQVYSWDIFDYFADTLLGKVNERVAGLADVTAPGSPIPSELEDDCDALSTALTALAPVINGVRYPEFQIYGVYEKTADEPFSAFGDYDGDGVTNLQVYNDVVNASGSREDFVLLATGGPSPSYMDIFEEQWAGLRTDLGLGEEPVDVDGDGLPERWALRVVAVVLEYSQYPYHDAVYDAYIENLLELVNEGSSVAPYRECLAALLLMGQDVRDFFISQLGLTGSYDVFTGSGKAANEPFSGEGDLDHDGLTNAEEYETVISYGGTIEDFAEVAVYWAGAGPLPAVGAVGLALAALACAGIGACALRRKARRQ